MRGRAFLDLARELAAGTTEAHWRTAVGRAYYALMLEGLETLQHWGFTVPPQHNVHSFVRLRFTFAADADLKAIGRTLDQLVRWRNQADYHLAPSALFASAATAGQAVPLARRAVDLLDRIDGDPARRTAAIASIRP